MAMTRNELGNTGPSRGGLVHSALIVNLNAGRFQRQPGLTRQLEAIIQGQVRVFKTASVEQLRRAVSDLANEGISRLIICGGDGTVSSTVAALIAEWEDRPYPELSIVPLGTVNTIARNMQLRERPLAVLEQLLQSDARPEGHRSSQHHVLAINDHWGFFFAAGMPAQFFKDT